MEKKLACIRITYEKLAELLKISSKSEIIDIFAAADDRRRQSFDVVIRGEKGKEVFEGKEIPFFNYEYFIRDE